MRRRGASTWIVVSALLCAGALHAADEVNAPPTETTTAQAALQPPAPPPPASADAPPTLPPVVVKPEQDPNEPIELNSPLGDSPLDRPFSYPRLREQTLEGLNSASRGAKSLFDLPEHGQIITRRQLDERATTDMVRALQGEVGVLMQQTARGQASPFVRGLTGQQVLLMIDGVRLNNGTYRAGPNQYFNLIDPGSIGAIEVLRGPQSVLWGSDAIGGAINVQTRFADLERGEHVGGSWLNTYSTADRGIYSRLNGEGALGAGDIFFGASYLNVRDLDRGGDLGRQPATNYDQYAADLRYNYLIGEDHVLTVVLQHFEQRDVPRSDRFLPFVQGTPPNPAVLARPTYFNPQQRDLVYLRLQGLGDNFAFDGYSHTVSYQRNKEGSREERLAANPANTRIDLAEFDVDTVGYTLTLAKDLGDFGALTYGADLYHDEVDAYRFRTNPNLVNPPLVAQPPQFPTDSQYFRVGTFLSWDAPITERWVLTGGVRFENVDASGTTRINNVDTFVARTYQDGIGSLGSVFELTENLHLTGMVSEGFRAPNLDDLFADTSFLQGLQAAPSVDVRPERATNYEIGLKQDGPRWRWQIVEFWTSIHDYITRIPVNNLGQLDLTSNTFIRTNTQAYINGTELSGELLLAGGWSSYGNFWYTYGQDRVLNEPVSRIPPAQGILGLRWRNESHTRWWDLYTWMVNRQDRYAFVNTRDARFPVGGTPGYATLNLRSGRTLGARRQHRVSWNIENLTNKAYRVLGSGVDGPGVNGIFTWEYLR